MLDDAIRLGFLILGGLALGVVVIWYLGFLYKEVTGTGQVVIDPFTVVDDGGKANEELGKALAQMLQARLQSLVRELRDAQAGLSMKASTATVLQVPHVALVGDVRLWTQSAALQTRLLQPVDMKLSVGGVDVGGVLPWFQRHLSSKRTLHFTVYSRSSEAQVFGSLTPLGISDAGLRLRVAAPDGKSPALDTIIDQLAHEIIHRHLAQDTSNKLEVLDPLEFLSFTEVLVSAAQSNRKSLLGRPAQKEFVELLPRITALADKVPSWPELCYFAAWIADSGRDSETALRYYQNALHELDGVKQPTLVSSISDRISELTPRLAAASTAEGSAAPLPPALDYSAEIKLVRNNGEEGSVVGMALATALEFQIAKTTNQPPQISARYIYYAARQAGGGDLKSDSGARLKDAITILSSKGAVEESVWPYHAGQFAEPPPPAVEHARRFRIKDAKLLIGLDDIKRALQQHGPVVASINVFQSFMTLQVKKTGVIPLPKRNERFIGGHAIVIVGYDDTNRRLKFVNSWGADWGDHGFGYLPYAYFEEEKNLSDIWTFKLAT